MRKVYLLVLAKRPQRANLSGGKIVGNCLLLNLLVYLLQMRVEMRRKLFFLLKYKAKKNDGKTFPTFLSSLSIFHEFFFIFLW